MTPSSETRKYHLSLRMVKYEAIRILLNAKVVVDPLDAVTLKHEGDTGILSLPIGGKTKSIDFMLTEGDLEHNMDRFSEWILRPALRAAFPSVAPPTRFPCNFWKRHLHEPCGCLAPGWRERLPE